MKQQTKRRIAACAAGFALPRYNDIPSVGLYLDQAVQYVNGQYRCFPGVVLTPSMVSNYVKQGLVNHPVKKKYTREQLACLTCIALAKTVLSMENIRMLLEMQRASYPIQVVYDLFCDELEACLPCRRMRRTSGCCCAAPFWRRPTSCTWTAALKHCSRTIPFGRISCKT